MATGEQFLAAADGLGADRKGWGSLRRGRARLFGRWFLFARFRPGSGCADGGVVGWFADHHGAVGEGEGCLAGVGVEFDSPVEPVHQVVMPLAQENQVVEFCLAVLAPPFDVVGVGPCFFAGASGDAAAAVADCDGFAESGWDGVVFVSVVEDRVGAGTQHFVEDAVAQVCVGRP